MNPSWSVSSKALWPRSQGASVVGSREVAHPNLWTASLQWKYFTSAVEGATTRAAGSYVETNSLLNKKLRTKMLLLSKVVHPGEDGILGDTWDSMEVSN